MNVPAINRYAAIQSTLDREPGFHEAHYVDVEFRDADLSDILTHYAHKMARSLRLSRKQWAKRRKFRS